MEEESYIITYVAPAEGKIEPHVLQDITNTATMNHSITPKEVQKGKGMSYQPMNVSIAAANTDSCCEKGSKGSGKG